MHPDLASCWRRMTTDQALRRTLTLPSVGCPRGARRSAGADRVKAGARWAVGRPLRTPKPATAAAWSSFPRGRRPLKTPKEA